ncbi:MAG: chemotaxis-specific protein-glutamate methyltransferase CheB [Methylobacter sp.]|nr:MAG: chemotaxis-specific protein-glutamate methyltransferase CheB [Methylobacter sp.]
MAKIRVVLADDSSLARDMLRSLLENDGDIEVVGEAKNGAEAVRLAVELKPDLITMDLEMPVMGGMDAITEIMATRAVPILVVSSTADAGQAYAAVAHGALDAVSKPDLDPAVGAAFVAKVKMLSTIRVIRHIRSRFPEKSPAPASSSISPITSDSKPPVGTAIPCSDGDKLSRVFAIVSSTGGPQALATILGQLPADFPCPLLISQHIADGFAPGMAEWLASICKLPVRLAQEGEPLTPGTVYISPSESNLAVTPSRRITLAQRLLGEIYHPTCDVLLASIATVYGRQSVGIILTGMGSDGAAGIAKIRNAGGATLAQDEASSVIFGMNKIAIERGGVQQVLPADEIPRAMCRLATQEMP